MNTSQLTCKGDKGFTLVELAIVMIIIGLLIGGVLKGQELITNAQVTSTASQVKGFDAAITTFRDAQNALPGDLATPNVRLPNCAGVPCSRVGNANGIINGAGLPGVANTTDDEAGAAWAQMNAANLISGVQQDAALQGFGTLTPSASIGGGYFLNYSANGAANARTGPLFPVGHYLTLAGVANANLSGNNGLLTTAKAARIDRKLDDGIPNSGNVRGAGTNCASVATVAGVWNEANETARCALHIRVQN